MVDVDVEVEVDLAPDEYRLVKICPASASGMVCMAVYFLFCPAFLHRIFFPRGVAAAIVFCDSRPVLLKSDPRV